MLFECRVANSGDGMLRRGHAGPRILGSRTPLYTTDTNLLRIFQHPTTYCCSPITYVRYLALLSYLEVINNIVSWVRLRYWLG